MIGPAVQGVLFLSVIYWYTKGMLNLINDYYRDEFKAYIDKDTKKDSSSSDTQLSIGDIETCEAMHVEGLPDVLKSSNDLTKSDGIVTRQIDKNSGNKPQCDTQPAITTTKNTIKKDNFDNENLSDQNQISTIKSASSDDTAELKPAKSQSEAIVGSISSYKVGQSNYRQMANQQASDVDDGESTKRTSSTRTDGNCFENVDGKSSVAEQLTPTSSIPTPPPSPTEPLAKDEAKLFGHTPGIAVNGVIVPADLIRQRIEEKLQKERCQRKTVNEMVKYWTNYMEAIDVAQSSSSSSPSSAIPRKLSTANKFDSRTMPRAKSSGEITTSAGRRTDDSFKNNS